MIFGNVLSKSSWFQESFDILTSFIEQVKGSSIPNTDATSVNALHLTNLSQSMVRVSLYNELLDFYKQMFKHKTGFSLFKKSFYLSSQVDWFNESCPAFRILGLNWNYEIIIFQIINYQSLRIKLIWKSFSPKKRSSKIE